MSELKLKGKIKEILEVTSGTSQAGKAWKKVTFSISNNDGYEGKELIHAFEVFGEEKVDKFIQYNKLGREVEVDFNSSSNRWVSPKGEIKYFTTNSAWKIMGTDISADAGTDLKETPKDDLPF